MTTDPTTALCEKLEAMAVRAERQDAALRRAWPNARPSIPAAEAATLREALAVVRNYRTQAEALAVARQGLEKIAPLNVQIAWHGDRYPAAVKIADETLARIDALTGKGEG